MYERCVVLNYLDEPAKSVNELPDIYRNDYSFSTGSCRGSFHDSSIRGQWGTGPAVRPHSQRKPRAIGFPFVAGIGQQPFRLTDKFFKQFRLFIKDVVDIKTAL